MPSHDGEVEPTLVCRACGSPDLESILSLGHTPLADGLLTSDEAASGRESRYPLEVVICRACSLVQLGHSVQPEILFGQDYPYYSSFSDALLAHAREHAQSILDRHPLSTESLVVELASNDGYLLRNFVELGIPVLGIDPAPGPAAAAQRIGVDTMVAFFGTDLARELRAKGMRADVVIGNNVLAHVRDLNGFVAGIATLLADDGIVSIEVPYVRDLVERREFDTIYHEHLCYFSVTAIVGLVRRHGLELVDVRRLPIHGGSMRLTVARAGTPVAAVVGEMLEAERVEGMDRPDYYRAFADDVRRIRAELRELLAEVKASGGRIAAYGAAAKGSTLLNYTGIGTDLIDFVVDRNVHKHGKVMPGVHLPIRPTDALLEEMPTHVLLLAWNFRDEIVGQQREYLERGGRFIVPVPRPAVV